MATTKSENMTRRAHPWARKLSLFAVAVVLILTFGIALDRTVQSFGQQPADSDQQALERLAWMPAHQTGMLNVDANEGATLRDQVIKVKAKRALEIGTSNGYSTIWIALGVRKTGGRLVTLEIDENKVKLARENFRIAGVDSVIELRHSDALKEIPKLQGPFEFVFIDAWKQDYVRYLEMVLPMVPPGGVIMAHNTKNLRSELLDFIQAVQTNPQLKTTFVEPGPGGFSVSVKLAGP